MMWFLLVVAVLAVAGLATVLYRQRQQSELEENLRMRSVRKVAEEDVTRFGEELQGLHIETLTTTLDTPMRQDYQRALDCYENAKELLADARRPEDISAVTRALQDGRYAQACVLTRRDSKPLPQRRPPCFFNPSHGPAETDVTWAPPGGVPREVPVCLADAERVTTGAEPDSRMVRAGTGMVPWYQGGPRYAPYADGYYGAYAFNGLFPGFLIGAMMAGMWSPAVVTDPTGGYGEDWSGDGGHGGEDGGGFGDSGGFGDGGGTGGSDFGDFGGGFDGF